MADVEVSASDDVSAHVGDTLVISLPETATTGFVWTVTDVGEGLVVQTDESQPPADRTPGAGGRHVVRVRVDQPGDWQINLQFGRPWERDAAEERRISVRAR